MIKFHEQENTMNYSDEDLKKMTEWSEKNKNDEPIHPVGKSKPLREKGGLQNLAQPLSAGYTIAAFVMSSKTRAEVDAWIAAHPDRNAPFSTAPTEINESVEAIMVRIKAPDYDETDNDQVLAKMKALVAPLPKPKAGDVSKATGEMYEPK